MTRRTLLAPTLVLALTACSVRDRPELRYRGPLTPVAASPRCEPSIGVLQLRDTTFTFAPDEGTWILEGHVTPGTLDAKRGHPAADHRSFDTELKATWTEAEIRGVYTTPFCSYRVVLSAY